MIFRARTLRTTMCAAMMFSMAWTTLARGELEKVHSQVLEAVRKKGHASVLVGIKVPWKMEQTLNQADVMTQRQAIRAAQESLVSELDGTEYRIVREYQKIPGIALEIWPDALSILEKSDKVTNVVPDHPIITVTAEQPAPAPPSQSRTVRKVTASSDKVPAELFKKAKAAGTVLVLVGLKAPWQPEGLMSEDLVRVQRKAIAAAQNYLLVELGATRHRVTRLYKRIPGIALEVGVDALNVLAKSAAVTNVLADRPPKSTR